MIYFQSHILKNLYIFNKEQQKRINIAMKQVENGEFITHEQAEKDVQKWFNEQD